MAVRSCVVRAPNWVGDAVMSLGGLRAIRSILGETRLAVAARPWVAGLFEESGVVDEVIPLSTSVWRDARRLRRGRFDAAVLFPNSFASALVARLAGIPRVAGLATDGRRLFLTDVLDDSEKAVGEHESRLYMRIAAGFERALIGHSTVDVDAVDASLHPRAETIEHGRALLADAGVPAGAPVVALNPGSTNSRAKRWLPERFAAVGDELADRFGGRVAILGASAERETAERVARLMRDPERAAILAGRTSIRELVGVLANATALVSNDTGPAHIGAALGVPTVTVFGPTEHFATHPIGRRATLVRRPVDCSPCMLRDCPIDHRCMTGVEVDDVLRAFESVSAKTDE